MALIQSVHEEFNEYVAEVYTEPIPDRQRKDIKRAFIAGFAVAISEVAKTAGADDETAIRHLKRLCEECRDYAEQGVRGHRERNGKGRT